MVFYCCPNSYAQKFKDEYKKGTACENAGQYYEAFDMYRKSMLCKDAPKKNDAEMRARACYHLFREQEKVLNKRTAYDYTGPIENNRAIAILNKRYFLIDSLGNAISDTSYSDMYPDRRGICIVRQDSHFGLIGYDGKLLLQPKYTSVDVKSDSVIMFSRIGLIPEYGTENFLQIEYSYNFNRRAPADFLFITDYIHYGLLNNQDELLIEIKYDSLYSANNKDWFIARSGDSCMLKDSRDSTIFYSAKTAVEPYSNGFARVVSRKNNETKYGCLNTNGTMILPVKYFSVTGPHEGIFCVRFKNGKFGFIDSTGQKIASGFDRSSCFSNGIAIVSKKSKQGCINTKGSVIFPFKYASLQRFNDSLFIVKDDLYGICRWDRSMKLPMEYQFIENLNEGFFVAKKKNKLGLINDRGDIITDAIFSKIQPYSEGFAAVKENRQWYYLNEKGQPAFEERFKEANDFRMGMALVRKDHGFGIIDNSGKYILPAAFTRIEIDTIQQLLFAHDSSGLKTVCDFEGHNVYRYNYSSNQSDFRKSVSFIVADTSISVALNDTLFFIGKHVYTYREFIQTDLEIIRQQCDSTVFIGLVQFAACAEHNKVRLLYAEENKPLPTVFLREYMPELKLNNLMNSAAQQHCNNMAIHNFFSHGDPEGRSPFDRLQAVGIYYGSAGENIYHGGNTIQRAIQGWIFSEGHFENMTDPAYSEFGFGYTNEYFTAMFTN